MSKLIDEKAEKIVKRIVGVDLGIRLVGGRDYDQIVKDVANQLQEIQQARDEEIIEKLEKEYERVDSLEDDQAQVEFETEDEWEGFTSGLFKAKELIKSLSNKGK